MRIPGFRFVNYAHRGASSYAPENTLQAFFEGLRRGADGIETDVQISRDGIPVLFHDDTLERVCHEQGSVTDYSLSELKTFLVDAPNHVQALGPDRICTLDEFLRHFGFRDLIFAIEIKQDHPDLDDKVLDLIYQYGVSEKVILTSFNSEILSRLSLKGTGIKLGYLVREYSPEVESFADEFGIDQICLDGNYLTSEVLNRVYATGRSVRAWAIKDVTVMRRVLDLDVDGGMTINFPDLLAEELTLRS